jgi:hypothetical protein
VFNFGDNNFLFPWETKESSPIIDLAQGNLVAHELGCSEVNDAKRENPRFIGRFFWIFQWKFV